MSAVYNENDPAAAAWLRELMAVGEIAPGDVDERSIKEVRADDYAGYDQVHFFAGIGVWSHALRRSGWDDARPVCTGSCPCQPFSTAGAQAGFDDPRHLWPDFLRIILRARELGQPWARHIFGEQVANAGAWLDLVRSDLEAAGFAFAAVDLAAGGFGGAHQRNRLFWVADADNTEWWSDHAPGHDGDGPQARRIEGASHLAARGPDGGVAYPGSQDQSGWRIQGLGESDRTGAWAARERSEGFCAPLSLEHASGDGREQRRTEPGGRSADTRRAPLFVGDAGGQGLPVGSWTPDERGALRFQGPALGAAGALQRCDWLFCHDAKFRPVEPGSFPLVDASPSRVGRLRGYGNSLDAETATQFVSAYMDAVEGAMA